MSDFIKSSLPKLPAEQLEVIIEDAKNRITTHSVGDITPEYIERQQEIITLAKAQLEKVQKEQEVLLQEIKFKNDSSISLNPARTAIIRGRGSRFTERDLQQLLFSSMGVPEKYFERDNSSSNKKDDNE
ncbi:hypothetical protein AAXE64_27915 [Priestia megaterium]